MAPENLPKSKMFPQSMDNLEELINSSTIPNFSTNTTPSMLSNIDRVSIPILDKDATVNFYIAYKTQNRQKLKNLLKLKKIKITSPIELYLTKSSLLILL